jgi:hypothetical protein
MRDGNYPKLVSDPESEGLPGAADDDSTANDDVDTGRWADGPDPAALPADRPRAVTKFGTTAEEQLDNVAYDAGAAGGGASADELAMHETQAPGYH